MIFSSGLNLSDSKMIGNYYLTGLRAVMQLSVYRLNNQKFAVQISFKYMTEYITDNLGSLWIHEGSIVLPVFM
jgi:hypothetical protein